MPGTDPMLVPEETVLVHVRSHGKALVGPVMVFVVCLGVLGAGLGLMPAQWRPWGPWLLSAGVLLVVVAATVVPWLRWLSATVTITDRRVITRSGVVVQRGHDVAWRRVTDVTFERGPLDRLFGCGALVLLTAAERPLVLRDLPHIGEIHRLASTILTEDDVETAGYPTHR